MNSTARILNITSFVQPADYEPPFFTSNTNDEPTVWSREPLKMNVGHVDSKHYKLGVKVRLTTYLQSSQLPRITFTIFSY